MDQRGRDDLDWSMLNMNMVNDPLFTFPSSFPMRENQFQPYIPTGNYTSSDHHNYNRALNSLEAEFNRLNLSPAAAARRLPALPLYQQLYEEDHLQRSRAQSAATRFQMESYFFDQRRNSFNVAAHEYPPLPPPPRVYRNGSNIDFEQICNVDRYRYPSNNTNRYLNNQSTTTNTKPIDNYKSLSDMNKSLSDMRGGILRAAMNGEGCRFLQKVIEEGKGQNEDDIHLIYFELKEHVRELMIDPYANYLIQKFFEVCNEAQMDQLVWTVGHDDQKLISICHHQLGTISMQKMIEFINTQKQRSRIIPALSRIAVILAKSMNGHHVIQYCFKKFPSEETVVNMVADNCREIATDKNGCCVMQQCVPNAKGENLARILGAIYSNVRFLSKDPYGNYVIQYIIGQIPGATEHVLAQLVGSFVALSTNKHGSHIVEKILKESHGDGPINVIINELLNSPNFLSVVQDPYGNYVVQSALTASRGPERHRMINEIMGQYAFLHSHPHGKKVLARAKAISKARA